MILESDDFVQIFSEVEVSDNSKTYSAQAFVKIDDVYYYSVSVSHSVKSIAQTYILNHISNDIVDEHSLALKHILNN